MIHQNTSDKLQIQTSSTADVDVVITYNLFNQLEPFNKYYQYSSIAVHDVYLDQDGKVVIEMLSIKNNHGSTSNTITLKKDDGTDNPTLVKFTLAAGEIFTYVNGKGYAVFTTDGKLKVQTAAGGGGGASWGSISGTLSDQTDLQAALDAKQDAITDSDDITEGATNLFLTTSERSKLGGIEAGADVTDAANVAAAGAFMKSTDDTDDITEGSTKKFATAAEKTKLSYISVTQAVDLDAIESRVNDLDAAVILKGSWDASSGSFPGSGTAQAGWSYIVSVAGTVDGQSFNINDRIIAILDNASTSTFASNWFKADYTDQFLSLDGSTGAVTLGAVIVGLTGKTTPVDGDSLPLSDSASSNASKKVTWANFKATLKTYFDTLYQPLATALTQIAALTPTDDDILQRKSGSWVNRTMLQLKTDLSLTKSDVGLSNVDNTSDSSKNSAIATLTNKRITQRVTTITSNATPTVNTDNCDQVEITAQAADITSMTTNLSGTPVNGDKLLYRIEDNGTPRAITWGSSFEAKGVALPTTTTANKQLTVGFIYNGTKWGCIASVTEA